MTSLFYIVFLVLRRCFCENLYDTAIIVLLFFCFTSVFISANIIFYNFFELHSALSEQAFCRKFSFFNGFTQTPHPINGQNLLRVPNALCQFSLKWLLKYFLSQNFFWQNPAKASFMYQKWTGTVHIFLKVPTTDTLVFFSEHISRTAILKQASVITCKNNF